MRLPRVRFTVRRMMVVVAVVAVSLAVLPNPVFVLRLPNSSTATIPLPDGSLAMTRPTADIGVTPLGALLLAAIAVVIAFVTAWVAGQLLGTARRLVEPDATEPPK